MVRRLMLVIAVLAVVAGCSGGSTAISDPKEIVTKGMSTLQGVKTVHVRADITGSAPINLGTGSSDMTLDGTYIEGDIDIAGKKVDMTLAIPVLMGFTGEFIVIDNTTYVKASLLGPKWTKQVNSDSGSSTLGTASDPQKAIADIKAFLDKPDVAPQKLADEKCGDNKDCYHVKFTVPAGEIAGALASAGAGALASAAPLASGAAGTSVAVDMWVEKDTTRIDKIVITADMGSSGNVAVTLALSKWDEAVNVTAPPADQVQEGPLIPGLSSEMPALPSDLSGLPSEMPGSSVAVPPLPSVAP